MHQPPTREPTVTPRTACVSQSALRGSWIPVRPYVGEADQEGQGSGSWAAGKILVRGLNLLGDLKLSLSFCTVPHGSLKVPWLVESCVKSGR